MLNDVEVKYEITRNLDRMVEAKVTIRIVETDTSVTQKISFKEPDSDVIREFLEKHGLNSLSLFNRAVAASNASSNMLGLEKKK